MKTISLLFIISSFINSAVTESVMVNMGFSLTFHTNTVIQSNDVIEWRYGFKNELIAKLDRGSISLFNGSDGTFSDRLKINNQTGDLTVTDVTVPLIGLYHLQIPGEKITRMTFNIGCQSGFGGEVTSLAVMEGHSVRLSIGAPDRENYDVIRWKFQESPLLELNRKTRITSTHDDVHDERFRDMKLDHWSGDLTISNITTDLSGLYEVNIDSNSGTHTMHQSYTVTVQCEVKSVSVMEGDYVTLQADDQMQNDDLIEWWFGHQETLLGRLDNVGRAVRLYDGVWDVRFSDRFGLSVRDGSFIFRNITTAHAGLYEVTISSKRRSIQRTFIVTVSGVSGDEDGETVNEGSSVTLNSGLTELSKDDVIQWGFGQERTLIAEINKQADRITYYDVLGGRFTDRLKLDEQTGSLTIKNITNEQTGYYRRIINGVSKRLLLIVHAGDISVKEGASVTLNSDIAESREDDFTEWLFMAKNKTDGIAYSTSGSVMFYKRAFQGIFRDKLEMDKQTGSLTITNVTREHAGKYVFMTSNEDVHRSFNLTVSGVSGDEVNEEKPFITTL